MGSSINTIPSAKNYYKATQIANQLCELGISSLFRGNQQITDAILSGYYLGKHDNPLATPETVCLNCFEDTQKIQVDDKGSTKIVTDKLFQQKMVFNQFSNFGRIFFPGGTQIMDSFYEDLCLIQTRKTNALPIALVNSDFWTPWHDYFKNVLLPGGTISERDLSLYRIIDDADEVVPYLLGA